MGWIDPNQERDMWQALANAAMILWVPHTMWRISQLVKDWWASQEGFCSVEFQSNPLSYSLCLNYHH